MSEIYNPKNPDEFKQTLLDEPAPLPLNIVAVPEGSIVETGSLASPNFRKGQKGWRLSSDGTIEGVNAELSGTITGATIQTDDTDPRFLISPNAFQAINAAGNVVFENVLTGANAGDVIMGDDATGSYAEWDNSAGTFRIYGSNLTPTFGDGFDGDVTIAAGTTTLTRDMYYNNLVVTGTLITDGYKILVKGTISGAGTIQGTTANNGTNAVGSTIGTGGAVPGSGPLKGVKGSDGGSNGAGGGGANGAVGTGGSFGNVGALGGGGGSAGNPGGSGGTIGAIISAQTKILDRVSAVGMIYLTSAGGVAIQSPCGSTGGGQGGGAGVGPVPGAGGGAGSSGGLIWVAAGIWDGTFTISSVGGNGGNGGNGDSGGGAAGGGGGGAGGNGGSSFFIYATKTWSGSYTLTGGTGGNGGLKKTGGGGTAYDGAAGANGNGGTSHEFNIFDLL